MSQGAWLCINLSQGQCVAKKRKKIMPPNFLINTCQQHFTYFLINLVGK